MPPAISKLKAFMLIDCCACVCQFCQHAFVFVKSYLAIGKVITESKKCRLNSDVMHYYDVIFPLGKVSQNPCDRNKIEIYSIHSVIMCGKF